MLEAIDVIADQDLGEVQDLAAAAIKRLDEGDGVLVITDVKGGTPPTAATGWPMRAGWRSSRHQFADAAARHHLPPRHAGRGGRDGSGGAQSGAVRVDNRTRVGWCGEFLAMRTLIEIKKNDSARTRNYYKLGLHARFRQIHPTGSKIQKRCLADA
jgi:PTS system ascorbate-specific IIA component